MLSLLMSYVLATLKKNSHNFLCHTNQNVYHLPYEITSIMWKIKKNVFLNKKYILNYGISKDVFFLFKIKYVKLFLSVSKFTPTF